MKNPTLLLILLITFCISCKNTPEPQEEAPNTEPVVPEWVTYEGSDENGKHIVLVSGDEEYRSEEALPQLGKILSQHHGFKCTVLFAQDPENPGIIDPNYVNNIPGLSALESADLMILFTRFRDLPDDQMEHFKAYLEAGKPVIGIRTSTHAFHVRDTTSKWYHWGNFFNEADSPWDGGFGRLVLGERWHTHHGHHKQQSTRGLITPEAEEHPILRGIQNGEIWGPTDVYGVRLPLPGDSKNLVMGQVVNRAGEFDKNDPFFGMKDTDTEIATVNPASKKEYNPNDPIMPIAWTKSYQLPEGKAGKSFTTTIGSSTDQSNAAVRRLLVNAAYDLLGIEVPEAANVNIIGSYNPSPYNFHDNAHWDSLSLKIADHIMK